MTNEKSEEYQNEDAFSGNSLDMFDQCLTDSYLLQNA